MNGPRILWCVLLVTIVDVWMVFDGVHATKGRKKERTSRAITGQEIYRKVSHPLG